MILAEVNPSHVETAVAQEPPERFQDAWGLVVVANQINERLDRLRGELAAEIEKSDARLNKRIEQVEAKIDSFKTWYIGGVLTIVAGLLVNLFWGR